MSKKIFSVQEWENVHSEALPSKLNDVEKQTSSIVYSEVEEDLNRVVCEIESLHIDIAPSYNDWVNLGFAIADGCGESGRTYFHRLSKLHHDYKYAKTDKQYTYCLQGKRQGITMATFFYMAEQVGVSLKGSQISIYPNIQNGETGKWVKDECEMPAFPEDVYEQLPVFLKKVVDNAISSDDRGTILIGSIATLSVCFPNFCGVYDERVVYPNLYLFVTAEAGMGKGALTLCRELITPINRQLHELTKTLDAQYKADMAEYTKGKKSENAQMPEQPPIKTLIVPANSSASAFKRIAKENDGIVILFETEGDTLSQTLKSDFGNYSDVLRKAYHHEPLGANRAKDREFYDVDNPRISVVLAGTPEQVCRLTPTAEDGLFSRFAFYFIPFKRGFRNVFATSDMTQSKNAKFKLLGERFLHLRESFMREGNYTFYIPEYLQMQFLKHYESTNDECCDEVGNGMQGIVRRMGLMAYRIMMVLTAVRTFETETFKLPHAPDGSVHLFCQEEDFRTAMSICDTLLVHSVFIYRKLMRAQRRSVPDQQEKSVASRRNAFFELLPNTFTKKDYDALIEAQNENRSTASKWIDVFIKERRLCRVGQGIYQKKEG